MRFRSALKQIAVSLACATAAAMSGGFAETVKRPRDPWVFRCVLDKEARMAVVALHDHLWLAYNTNTCALVKAWDGDVKFDGAVYTTIHGPQPTSQGTTLLQGVADHAWNLKIHGKDITPVVSWKGYRFEDDGRVSLMYQLKAEGSDPIEVLESPEYVAGSGGGFALERRFTVSHAAAGTLIWVGAHVATPDGKAMDVTVNGKAMNVPAEADHNAAMPIAIDPAGVTTIRFALSNDSKSAAEPKKGNSK